MPSPGKSKRSGNPAVASSAEAFKKKRKVGLTELPSGEWVEIKRPDLAVLIGENVLGDQLSAMAQDAVNNATGIPTMDLAAMSKDPGAITKLMNTAARVAVLCWVSPTVTYHMGVQDKPDPENPGDFLWRPAKADEETAVTIPEADRDEDALYSDEIEFTDLIFTFQLASGGSPDLVRFRQQLGEGMAALQAGQGVENPTQ